MVKNAQKITDLLCPKPHRVGALCIDGRCLSVHLSVPCLILRQERKVTPLTDRKVKGQRHRDD